MKLKAILKVIILPFALLLCFYAYSHPLWEVRIDGNFAGWVADPSALGELAEGILAEKTENIRSEKGVPDSSYAAFSSHITYSQKRTFSQPDPMAVSKAIREQADVEVR